jgi:hypothetical protein
MCNAARLWLDSPAEQKLKFQAALFPQGLRMRDGGFGRRNVLGLGGNGNGNSGMASPTGVVSEWSREIPGEVAAAGAQIRPDTSCTHDFNKRCVRLDSQQQWPNASITAV